MRKFFAAVLAVVCVFCVAFAFGCAQNVAPNYYTVTYSETQVGVRVKFGDVVYEDGNEPEEFKSGVQVREGVSLKFEVQTSDEIVNPDEIVVKANDETLEKGDDGMYTVTVNSDIEIIVENARTEKIVRLVRGTITPNNTNPQDRITYLDEDGNELPEEYETNASQLKFSVKLSSYYKLQEGRSDISVTASTQLLEKVDGFYTLDLTDDTTVEVQGYEQDESFIDRREGDGSQENPFILRRPIDLYQVAGIVNTDFYMGRYGAAYYEMAEDIDLEGEQLYIIGDGVLSTAYFSGSFDGKGHTIKNFYVSDIIYDQESFTLLELVEIGMFGHVRPSMLNGVISVPVIKNLNLEDYSINLDKSGNASFHIGSIAGNIQGGSILNCKANGEINVSTAVNGSYVGYVGGIVGVVQSFYAPDVLRAESVIAGCTSNAEINCLSGNMYAAGGITGLLAGNEEKTPSYIVDCANTNSVVGAFRTGGIAGIVSPYSTVKNSLSTAPVVARCDLPVRPGVPETMLYAYAGGIAGYVDFESTVYGCYAAGGASATSVNGAGYQYSGHIAGGTGSASADFVESHDAVLLNNRSASENGAFNSTLMNEMGWSQLNWVWVPDASYPETSVRIDGRSDILAAAHKITVNYSKAAGISPADFVTDDLATYSSMAAHYFGEDLEEYVSLNNANRSYGYFFDEALTQRVLPSFAVTSDITLYAGFADYGEVAGRYYLRLEQAGSGAYLEFDDEGTVNYRNGPQSYQSQFVYDGENILLPYHPLFTVSQAIVDNNGNPVVNAAGQPTYNVTIYSGKGSASGGILTLYDNHVYTESDRLTAKFDGREIVCGAYYTENNAEYVFNKDGTGTRNDVPFEYTVTNNRIIITYPNSSETGTLDSNGVPVSVTSATLSPYDSFRGTWEAKYTNHTQYTFDGKGGWSYEYFGYTGGANSAKQPIASGSGTYTVTGNTLTLDNETTVTLGNGGSLTIDGVQYYKQSSFVGSWRYFARRAANVVELNFGGIGGDGYGTATATVGSGSEIYNLHYVSGTDNGVEYVLLYEDETQVGRLEYSISDYTLNGWVSGLGGLTMGELKFCLYDDLRGVWENTDRDFAVTFNGQGLYDGLSGSNIMVVNGSANVNGTSVDYLLDNATLSGSFTYRNNRYEITYNPVDDTVTVSTSGETFTLTRRVSA